MNFKEKLKKMLEEYNKKGLTKELIEKYLLNNNRKSLNANMVKFIRETPQEIYNTYYNETNTCSVCKKTLPFQSFNYGYVKHNSCEKAKKLIANLTKENIKKYLLTKTNTIDANVMKFLPYTLEEIYNVYHNIKHPKCYCGKELKLINFKEGYHQYCSKECGAKSKDRLKKVKDTCLKKYGTNSPFSSEKIKKKIRETNLKRYGSKNPMQNEKIKRKAKQTCLSKYGQDNPSKNKEISNKIRQSLLKNRKENWKNLDKLNREYVLEHFVKNNLFLIKEFCEFFNISFSRARFVKEELNIQISNKNYKNITQEEIYNFIKENYNSEVRFNDRQIISPLELDIYLPELNFAIEYNGLMYHSFGKSDYSVFDNTKIDMKIHLKKTELCEEKGIHLFQIFENEWVDPIKQDIWKSKILIKLHSSKIQKLNARDLIIKEVRDTKLIRKFLEENHLQGFIPSSIKIGLFKGNELISLATFGKSRFKKDESELLRFATKKYTIVRGGLSRILNYLFKNHNINKLISYANRRWSFSKSNVYNQVGFQVINNTEPNYFYFKPEEYILYNRIKFQKHKLEKQLKYFNSNLTEIENMFNNGYRLIPDCGNIKYIIQKYAFKHI